MQTQNAIETLAQIEQFLKGHGVKRAARHAWETLGAASDLGRAFDWNEEQVIDAAVVLAERVALPEL